MRNNRTVIVNGLTTLTLAILALVVSGCSSPGTAPSTMRHVNAHGSNPDHAQRNAIEKATAACRDNRPIVLDKRLYPTPPAYDELANHATAPGKISGLAASSYEGDSPAVRLSFRCTG